MFHKNMDSFRTVMCEIEPPGSGLHERQVQGWKKKSQVPLSALSTLYRRSLKVIEKIIAKDQRPIHKVRR